MSVFFTKHMLQKQWKKQKKIPSVFLLACMQQVHNPFLAESYFFMKFLNNIWCALAFHWCTAVHQLLSLSKTAFTIKKMSDRVYQYQNLWTNEPYEIGSVK